MRTKFGTSSPTLFNSLLLLILAFNYSNYGLDKNFVRSTCHIMWRKIRLSSLLGSSLIYSFANQKKTHEGIILNHSWRLWKRYQITLTNDIWGWSINHGSNSLAKNWLGIIEHYQNAVWCCDAKCHWIGKSILIAIKKI